MALSSVLLAKPHVAAVTPRHHMASNVSHLTPSSQQRISVASRRFAFEFTPDIFAAWTGQIFQ
jgi:hypothetical protein